MRRGIKHRHDDDEVQRTAGDEEPRSVLAGNLPNVSEIAPLLVVIRLEENDTAGATAIAVVMLAISFASLLSINLLQAFARRRLGHG